MDTEAGRIEAQLGTRVPNVGSTPEKVLRPLGALWDEADDCLDACRLPLQGW